MAYGRPGAPVGRRRHVGPLATLAAVSTTGQGTPSGSGLQELGAALRAWAVEGVGVVRVLERHGFGTVESGQLVAGTVAGALAGSVYRGTLDDTVASLAAAAVGGPRTQEAHVSDAAAHDAGLACSGGATLLGHPLPAEPAAALGEALERGVPAALVSTTAGVGALVLTGPDLAAVRGGLGSSELDGAGIEAARRLLRRGA